MTKIIVSNIRGLLSFFIYFLNTIFWSTPILFFAVFKLLIPIKVFRKRMDVILNACASNWIWVNGITQNVLCNIRWQIYGMDNFKKDDWYLLMCNHQSWVDILVLQRIFHKKIPFPKFFAKQQLIWLPVLGQVWWAMDFPFMKRYSSEFIKKNPHLKGKDLIATRKACEKFKEMPISVMNFVEGTRFTPAKHKKQGSPFSHLLKPKAGGIGLVLDAMGDYLHSFMDVTIVYPEKKIYFWDFMCGNVTNIRIQVRTLPITQEMLGDYFNDEVFRGAFQQWVNALWEQKDRCIEDLLALPAPRPDAEPEGASVSPFSEPFPVFNAVMLNKETPAPAR